ncbi:MAG: circularly permuted type 2 ATP-grasp protein [Candidatus Kryptoniota bacterium]
MSFTSLLESYPLIPGVWDELRNETSVREHYEIIRRMIGSFSRDELDQRHKQAAELFMSRGITFTVYFDNAGIERIFPFDIIPRIITSSEWQHLENGIKQRLKALNLFLKDIYSDQQILKDNIIPHSLIASCPHYLREAHGIFVPSDIHVHIAGIDLIRGEDGTFYVLEDNLRTPSGVSYMLENRDVTKRIFPDLFAGAHVKMVTNYPLILHDILVSLSPQPSRDNTVVLLTPGPFNSAYYEHTFLARQMGIELVEARDLVIDDHKVFMKTTAGLRQVDVIYRRVDDEFLDPLVFRPDSALGVPGLMSAYRKGNVAIVNAVGNGVADDKAIYSYVPAMIKFYLNEDQILPNVPTYHMQDNDERELVFKNLHKMVVKQTNQSGGYGMLMGDKASDEEIKKMKADVARNPRNYIGQPIIQLSTVPCFIDGRLEPRRVDLRPYALCGPSGIEIVPGGLTRVALKEGSLVVNSSQGGGSKDTWVID